MTRTERFERFVHDLNREDYNLIGMFMKLRSDHLDACRGLPPWPEDINYERNELCTEV